MWVHTIILGDFVIYIPYFATYNKFLVEWTGKTASCTWNFLRLRFLDRNARPNHVYKYDSCVPLLLTEQTVRGNTSLRALSLWRTGVVITQISSNKQWINFRRPQKPLLGLVYRKLSPTYNGWRPNSNSTCSCKRGHTLLISVMLVTWK